jgi:hypothetical protein
MVTLKNGTITMGKGLFTLSVVLASLLVLSTLVVATQVTIIQEIETPAKGLSKAELGYKPDLARDKCDAQEVAKTCCKVSGGKEGCKTHCKNRAKKCDWIDSEKQACITAVNDQCKAQ